MIRAAFFIEAQGSNKQQVEESLKDLVQKITGEADVKVKRTSFEDVLEEEGRYSQAVEVEIEFANFGTYIRGIISYAPSAVEIMNPRRLTIPKHEFLMAVGDVIKVSRALYEKHRASFKFPNSSKKAKIGLSDNEIMEFQYQGAIRAKIIIETRDRSPEQMVEDFVNIVKEDVFINQVGTKDVQGDEAIGVVGIDCFMYEPKTLMDIAARLIPVLVEITEPDEVELDILNIQDIGVDLSGIIFELSHQV